MSDPDRQIHEYDLKFEKLDFEIAHKLHLSRAIRYNMFYGGIGAMLQKHLQPDFMNHRIEERWCYYIYLWLEGITEDVESYWPDDEMDLGVHPILSNIDFHCEMTWHSKEIATQYKVKGPNLTVRRLKLGCDYNHACDTYDPPLASVISDVKTTIDSFWGLMPEYRLRCRGNGKYYPSAEGKFVHGLFYSDEYSKSEKKQRDAAR